MSSLRIVKAESRLEGLAGRRSVSNRKYLDRLFSRQDW